MVTIIRTKTNVALLKSCLKGSQSSNRIYSRIYKMVSMSVASGRANYSIEIPQMKVDALTKCQRSLWNGQWMLSCVFAWLLFGQVVSCLSNVHSESFWLFNSPRSCRITLRYIPETKWMTLGHGKLTSKAKHPQALFLFERLGKAFKTARLPHPGKKLLWVESVELSPTHIPNLPQNSVEQLWEYKQQFKKFQPQDMAQVTRITKHLRMAPWTPWPNLQYLNLQLRYKKHQVQVPIELFLPWTLNS